MGLYLRRAPGCASGAPQRGVGIIEGLGDVGRRGPRIHRSSQSAGVLVCGHDRRSEEGAHPVGGPRKREARSIALWNGMAACAVGRGAWNRGRVGRIRGTRERGCDTELPVGHGILGRLCATGLWQR